MIKITNGKTTLLVGKKSFEDIYKPSGWVNADDDIAEVADVNETEVDKETEIGEVTEEVEIVEEVESDDVTKLFSVPVSSMSNKELKSVAAYFDLDIAGKDKPTVQKEVSEAILAHEG